MYIEILILIFFQQEANIVESITNDTKIGTEPVSASKQVKDETNLMQENLSGAIAEEPSKITKKEENKQENKQEKKSPEMTEIKLEGETDEQVDMSGMINQNFIDIARE